MYTVKIEFQDGRFYSRISRTIIGAAGWISEVLEKESGEVLDKIVIERIDA